MISAKEYNIKWTRLLVKNKDKDKGYSYIDFFGEFEYDINPETSGGDLMAKIAKMKAFAAGKPVPKNKNEEDKPKPIILRTKNIWVEGTRDNFAMYIYNNKSDSDDEEEKKFYFKASNYGSIGSGSTTFFKLFQGTKKSDTKNPTFYSLRYKDGIPLIICNDPKIPEKYFILNGNKFGHTKNIDMAVKQSVMNFYRFADEKTTKIIKDYEDEQERIRLKKLRLEKEAALRAALKAKIIKYSIIGGSILLLLVIIYFVFLRKSGKKKKLKKLPNYINDDDDDDDDDE